MFVLPRFTTAVPAPLVAIVLLTAFVLISHVTVPNVGDEGTLPDRLPTLGIPDVPLTLATLQLIAPYALGIALVGLMESRKPPGFTLDEMRDLLLILDDLNAGTGDRGALLDRLAGYHEADGLPDVGDDDTVRR